MALRVEDIDLAADRELVERWQAGEHEVFDDLYRRYFNRLRSYCRKRVGDHDTAEEIAQEAFVKALQALPKLAGERRFYPWVTVIASRLCVDHHRRLGRVRPVEEVDAGIVDEDHGARLAFLADVDNLDRAMQRLGPRHLEVLELRERAGMSYAAIADHLSVPQSTVEALLFRARKALRREFMAVSGEGKLAAIPVLGAVLRRLAAARDRVAELMPSLSQLGSPIAAGAMAVMLSGAPMATSAAPTATTPLASPIRPIAPPAATPSKIAAPNASASTATRQTSAPQNLEPAPRSYVPLEHAGDRTAAHEASTMPVSLDAGPVSAGADPNTVADWVLLLGKDDR